MAWTSLLWAGLVATTVATAFFWLARSVGLTRLDPSVQIGCIFTRKPHAPITESVGFAVLFVMGLTIGPALFRALLSLWGGPAWIGGLVFGGFLGVLLAGLLPLFGTISACIRNGILPPPGPFGIGWGKPTPAVLFAGYMLYGALVAAILAAF